jgi:hypothetical protein
VPYGYDGRLSKYIVKIIRIRCRLMDIFEIIDQYHITATYNDDNDNNNNDDNDDNSDSRSGDEKNTVL